jgi:hypothetical protein
MGVVEVLDDGFERFVGQQTGDRERQLRDDSAVIDHDDAAAELLEAIDARGHVLIRDAYDDDVVSIVRDGRRQRSPLEAEAGNETLADPARRMMAFENRDLGEVASWVRHR